jgi:c-di-GMP-related signal transduction protein
MEAFVARQPVFDRNKFVFGYELLFRSCMVNSFEGAGDGPDEKFATSQVIATSLLAIGLEKLLSGRRAFINFGRSQLLHQLASVLPKELLVVEVLETVEADSAVIEACRRLKSMGYMIALDDFVSGGSCDPLLQYADIIKVDFRLTPRDEQKRLIQAYSRKGIKMLAEKLETGEEYEWARAAGYDYFQGYFFARPTIVRAKQIAPSKISAIRLMRELQKPELNYQQLESLIRQDVSFSYKLLRYVNSAAVEFRNPIQSIQHALKVLGDTQIRRWTTLVALPGMANDKWSEVVSHALVRARFCELLGLRVAEGATEPTSAGADVFLMGMFSLLDAMIDRPLEEIVTDLGLPDGLIQPLLKRATCGSPAAAILRLAIAYETAEWTEVHREAVHLRVADCDVASAYLESLKWVDQLLEATSGTAKPR